MNPYNYNYNNQINNNKAPSPRQLNNNIVNNLLLKNKDSSPNDAKQYKYEQPNIKNANNYPINNNKVSPQSILQPKSNILNVNNNINVRPISSKDQKVLINNNLNVGGGNIVNSIKKIVAPIGNQIKIAENLLKNNNIKQNYNNIKSVNPAQIPNNYNRPNSAIKVEPNKLHNNGGYKNIIKK